VAVPLLAQLIVLLGWQKWLGVRVLSIARLRYVARFSQAESRSHVDEMIWGALQSPAVPAYPKEIFIIPSFVCEQQKAAQPTNSISAEVEPFNLSVELPSTHTKE